MGQSRRQFTPEFKAEAVRMVVEDVRPPAQVAKELGIDRQLLAGWLKRARAASAEERSTAPLVPEERVELMRLRREVNRLKMEREFLKKAAAFFAKESK